jgi:adenine-specific DNA-methyltransferase
LDKVYSLTTKRVKTGFVFDATPKVNHNNICLAIENEKLFIGSGIWTEHKLIIGENYDALKNCV